MKITVELPDALMRKAKSFAAERGVPLREVFQQGLEAALRNQVAARKHFRLKTITTKGEGLQVQGGWDEIRSTVYEGHGG
jgi:hypothetical protein